MITNPRHWRSVMVVPKAKRLTRPDEMESAMHVILERNPTLIPAINKTKIGGWTRSNHIALYRVCPDAIYERETIGEEA